VFDGAGPERFVLDFEAVTFVDLTAARALKRLLGEVTSRDAELSVARASQAVHHQMDEAGLGEAVGESRFYPSVRAAVRGDGMRGRRSRRPPVGDAG
jgi:MFS superfamily sulfate permease-like transporter